MGRYHSEVILAEMEKTFSTCKMLQRGTEWKKWEAMLNKTNGKGCIELLANAGKLHHIFDVILLNLNLNLNPNLNLNLNYNLDLDLNLHFHFHLHSYPTQDIILPSPQL